MIPTTSQFLTTQFVLSVRVRFENRGPVFVVTSNPAFASSVKDMLDHQGDTAAAVVWLPSMAGARRRLAMAPAEMVIVDQFAGFGADNDELAELRSASPGTPVLVWADNMVR